MELLQNVTLVDKGGRRRPAKEALRVWSSFFVNLLFMRLNETGLQSCCLLLFCALVSSLSPVYSSSRKVHLVTHSDHAHNQGNLWCQRFHGNTGHNKIQQLTSRKQELKIFDFAGHTQGLVLVDREGQFRFDPVLTVIYSPTFR